MYYLIACFGVIGLGPLHIKIVIAIKSEDPVDTIRNILFPVQPEPGGQDAIEIYRVCNSFYLNGLLAEKTGGKT